MTATCMIIKKPQFPLFPLCIKAYKFSRVKGAEYFMKDLEVFHFGAKSFARNDCRKKAVEHCAMVKIHFEYADFFNKDEEVFRRANNMTELNKCFAQKSGASARNTISATMEARLQKQKEEAVKLKIAEA